MRNKIENFVRKWQETIVDLKLNAMTAIDSLASFYDMSREEAEATY